MTSSPTTADRDRFTAICSLFGATVLFGAGYGIWDNVAVNLHLLALFSSLACYVGAFVLIVLGFVRSRYAARAIFIGVAFAFVVDAGSYVLFKVPSYESDAMLFDSYSAQLLIGGNDPYTQTMQPGYRIFGVPEGVTTPTLNGGEVYALSYPALSFLVYVPFLALGITNVLWVSVAAHLLIIVILVRAAPASLKTLAPFLLFLDPTYFDYTVGGITDVLWLPAGMLTAILWKRNPTAAGFWLGVACAFKQTPWVIVPFALVFWLRHAWVTRRSDAAVRPVLATLAAFVIPNAPFAIWHPAAWFAGVTTPLSAHLIVLGTGIAQLATSGLLDLSARAFTAMTFAAFAMTFALYIAMPRRLAFLPFLAPAFVFFFASRSLHNYFMYWPIVLLTYLFSNWRDDREETSAPERFAGAKTAGIVATCALLLVPILARPAVATVQVKILGGSRSRLTGRVDTLHLAVTNAIARRVFIRFDVKEQGVEVDVQAWKPRTLLALEPGESRTYTIAAPRNDLELESDGTTSTQVVVIDVDGAESYSPPVVFAGRTPTIHNADFGYWSNGSHPFPVAWQFDPKDWLLGRVAKAAIGGESGVALRAAPAGGTAWRPTFLEQLTDARPGTIEFRLYPTFDYTGDGRLRGLFGAELRDVVGHTIYFTIDSRRRSAATYRDGRRIVVSLPGKLDAWNVVTVDLTTLQRRQGFVLSPDATMVVGAVASSDAPTEKIAGYFGAVRSLDKDSPSDMDPHERAAPSATPRARQATLLVRREYGTADRSNDAISLTGRWEHVSDRHDGRYRGASSRSFETGATWTLAFDGTGVRAFGVVGPSGGHAEMGVDGARVDVDFYAPVKATHVLLFHDEALKPGRHRFRVVVKPVARARPDRRYVNVDLIEVELPEKRRFTQLPIASPPRVR